MSLGEPMKPRASLRRAITRTSGVSSIGRAAVLVVMLVFLSTTSLGAPSQPTPPPASSPISFVGTSSLCHCTCNMGGRDCAAAGTVCVCILSVDGGCQCHALDQVAY